MRLTMIHRQLFMTLTLALSLATFTHAADKPVNLLILYADDLGWGETGCQGNKDIPTPNIDSIAKNGLRCTQGYVAATYCSPSRAGLMTAKYPTRFGHEFNSTANKSGLVLEERTIADRLKEKGYATACIGKWHLGHDEPYRPMKRGFDEFYGTLANTPFYHPTNFIDSRISPEVRKVEDENFYTTDAYAERAVDWLGKQKDKPWFLYLPFNAQHAPLQAPKKYLDRFPNITDEKRKLFAAMMSAMDDAIGRVLGKVRDMGQENNTLVFFIGDNGGPTQSTTSQNGGLKGFKSTTYEGGPRVPFLIQWKGTLPEGKTYDLPVVNLDVLPTAWAAIGGSADALPKIDGVNLLPYLKGEKTARPHETLYWRFGPQWAIRHGDWKLVVARGGSGKPELYHLGKDPFESKDLAGDEPETVKNLQAMWNAWSKEQAEPSAPDAPAKQKKNKKKKQAATTNT